MVCEKCGAKLKDNFIFCLSCKHRHDIKTFEELRQKEKSNKARDTGVEKCIVKSAETN